MIISHFSKAKRIMQRGPAIIHSPCSTHILILYCSAMCTSGERLSCRLCEHSSITHAHSTAQEEATHGRLGGRTASATTVAEKWKIAQAVACKAGNLLGKVGVGLCSGSCHLPRTSGSARRQSRIWCGRWPGAGHAVSPRALRESWRDCKSQHTNGEMPQDMVPCTKHSWVQWVGVPWWWELAGRLWRPAGCAVMEGECEPAAGEERQALVGEASGGLIWSTCKSQCAVAPIHWPDLLLPKVCCLPVIQIQDVVEKLPRVCPAHEPSSSMILVKENFNTSWMTTGLCGVEERARGPRLFSRRFWSVLRKICDAGNG